MTAGRRPHPRDSRHGTYSGYKNYGCRCEPCLLAMRTYDRARRARRRAGGTTPPSWRISGPMTPDDPRHGQARGYSKGCRCVRCSSARAEYDADRTDRGVDRRGSDGRTRAVSLSVFPETYEPWTDEWDDPTADAALRGM